MKRIVVVLVSVIILAFLCIILVACGENTNVSNYGYQSSNYGSTNNSSSHSSNYGSSNTGTSNPSSEINGITLSTVSLSLDEGTSETLNATISPSNAPNKTINWSSSDTSVATVQNGIVTAQNVGTCIITAQSANGITANCTVTVKLGEFVFSEYSYGYAMVAYTGSQSNVTVPSTYKGKPVLAIGTLTNESSSAGAYDGFYGNGTLVTVNLPEGLKDINRASFAGCSSLKSVVVPNSCVRIRFCAFSRCSSLEEIVIPPYCSYGERILANCINIKRLTLPVININGYTTSDLATYLFDEPSELKQGIELTINGGTSVGNWEGIKNKLNSLTIETSATGITYIGDRAFAGYRDLRSISIGNNIVSIGDSAFCYTSISSVVLPNSLTYIAPNLFSACYSLSEITIPDSIKTIGECAFYGCQSLKSIKLPNSISHIADYAFSSCTAMSSIYLPESISFERNAFSSSALTDIYYGGTKAQWEKVYKGGYITEKIKDKWVYEYWDYWLHSYTVHCTDGNIVKS